ncbi:MAG: SxtJ family membrane protein [Deltaproteobacteria bacterium]
MSPRASKQAGTREVRTFGATLGVAAIVIGLVAWRRAFPPVASVSAVVLATLAALSLVAPRAARPLQRGWMALGHALGRVTTPIVLTAVFVLVLTPARLMLMLFGRDPLQRGRDPGLRTYWTDRPRSAFTREDFERLS